MLPTRPELPTRSMRSGGIDDERNHCGRGGNPSIRPWLGTEFPERQPVLAPSGRTRPNPYPVFDCRSRVTIAFAPDW